MEEKKRSGLIVGIVAAAVVVVVLLIVLLKSPPMPEPVPVTAPREPTERKQGEVLTVDRVPVVEEVTPSPTETPVEPEETVVAQESTTEESREFNPEDQPREFFVMDFTEMSELPDGYTLEDLELTAEGITLKPLEPGEEDKPRYGVLTSPPEKMYFPSNAVSPLWRQEVSEGTQVFVEVQVSPDGEDWGIWHPLHYDEDAGEPTEFYPDGSPNPNYGYTPGGVLCWGYRQYNYFRYRTTLYSETEDSPVLSGFRLFYQDSTLGKGHIAEVSEMKEEGPE